MALGFTFHLPSYYPAFYNLPLTRTVETEYVEVTVYPTFYKYIVVEFSVPPSWGNCTFDVYRAESDSGPWSKLTPAPISGTFFKDTTTHDFSKFMNGWYVVEAILPSGKRVQSPWTSWENKRTSWVEIRAKEIIRRESLLLEKFTGVKSLIFRRKHFGMRCPNCWDTFSEKITKDHCTVCLGTSFVGGYFTGFETLIQYQPTPNDATLDFRGRDESNSIPAWTINYPEIETFDLVLRVPDWKLYRVDEITATELQATPVRQMFTLTELAKESIEFRLASQAMPVEYQ